MIEIDEWKPSGPIEIRCPHCETGGALYMPSEEGVRCDTCPWDIQPHDHTPIVVSVILKA
jgi:ribosomal protein S27E